MQSALQEFSGQITYHLPSHRLLKLSRETALSLKPLNSHTPLKGVIRELALTISYTLGVTQIYHVSSQKAMPELAPLGQHPNQIH
ncbi:hypothetical protein Nmel_014153 [Mimus melanotis]